PRSHLTARIEDELLADPIDARLMIPKSAQAARVRIDFRFKVLVPYYVSIRQPHPRRRRDSGIAYRQPCEPKRRYVDDGPGAVLIDLISLQRTARFYLRWWTGQVDDHTPRETTRIQ